MKPLLAAGSHLAPIALDALLLLLLYTAAMREGEPEWWPYADDFPGWEVWLGADGRCYARRLLSSPPVVVWGEDPPDLRAALQRAELAWQHRGGGR